MNYRAFTLIQFFSAALAVAHGKLLSMQRKKSSPDWTEALDDFKTLVHVISFGEEIPSHHSNPLQMLVMDTNSELKKNPFDLPDGWFGKEKKKERSNKKRKSDKKYKSKKNSKKSKSRMEALSPSQLQNQQSLDDLALLNFLVQLEEPNTRSTVQMPKNKKHLSSLIMAESRYNEIKKKLSSPKKPAMSAKSKTPSKPLLKSDPKKAGNKKNNDSKQGKKWYERIDAKGAKNTLTLSVAFGVIVTALFCVVVQLFKLFANPKGSGNGSSAFDQINRRSTLGYDRIALDVEDDEENAQS